MVRGLSKFYQGKSQSFTSLAKVASLEDLAKKETPYQRKLKACRSYGGDLSNFRSYTLPKAGISKKVSKGSLSNLSCLSRKSSLIDSCRPPLGPVQTSF
ncbi:Extracellular matrix-binding protein ebh [Bienertia sinuspersici]